MRRALALLVLLFLSLPTAFAGVNSHQAMFYGGSTTNPPLNATGFLDAKDESHVNFAYRAGKNGEVGHYTAAAFTVPYTSITKIIYGNAKHLRIGQTLALTALAGVGGLLLLFSKNHTHYLTFNFTDGESHDQTISFEVGKDAIQPLINSLELRTGKKVEYEHISPGKTK
jgi:hypothetical protein